MNSVSETEHRVTPATNDEERLNHGVITVLEQTRETDVHDVGDRYVILGYETELYTLVDKGTEDQGFEVQAVPLAHIQLPQLLEDDELNDWLNTDVGKLVMRPFFDVMDAPPVLTEWGEERISLSETGDQYGPVMSASRLAAELGHSHSVKRAEVQFPYRIHLRVTDDGLSRMDMNTIREYGWKVSGFGRRINGLGVSVVCDDLRGDS